MTPKSRRSFAIKTNSYGKPMWSWNYSNFPPTEFDLDEIAKDVVFIPVANQFVVVGEYTRYQHTDLDRRMIFQIRAGINKGDIGVDNSVCNASMTARMHNELSTTSSKGQTVAEGSVNGYSLPVESLPFNWNYCFYSSETNPKLLAGKSSDAAESVSLKTVPFLNPKPWLTAVGELYDINGRVVRHIPISEGSERVSFSNHDLASGMYVLRISQEGKWVQSEKIWIK